MSKEKTIEKLNGMYLDRQVVIGFNNYEIRGKLINIDEKDYHLWDAKLTCLRDSEKIVSEHQAISVSRGCIFIGIA